MTSSGFVNLEHTADWAIRVRGADLPDLLKQAAAGMLSLADPSPLSNGPSSHRKILLRASDRETLLVHWLEELHFLLEAQGQVPHRMRLTISPDLRLSADLETVPVETAGRAIKAVTFHDLEVVDTADGLEATVVFDV